MNKMIPTHRTSMVSAIFKGLAGTIFIFAFLTAISYQNDLPVDGKLVIGFPWEFYSEGTGYNLERDEYASFENFEPLKLIGNFLIAVAIYFILSLSLRPLFEKINANFYCYYYPFVKVMLFANTV